MNEFQSHFRKIDTPEEYLSLDSTGLAGTEISCPYCGRIHRIPIRRILIGDDLNTKFPTLLADTLGKFPHRMLVVYDRAIEDIVEAGVLRRLREAGLALELLPLGSPGLLLEATVALGDEAAAQVPADADLILGVGSGVISDLTKWIADRTGKPFLLYGTAPSMNAHTSITAAMTEEGVKRTKYLEPAQAVLFDLPILAEAPLPMRQAGVGDLMARAICNADWRLSNVMRDTYFCPLPYQLTARHEKRYLAVSAGIRQGDLGAIRALSEAILVSGISMTMLAGETSPSSGSEHIFSHFWDLQVGAQGAPKNLHGIQVAIGTVLAFTLYEYMRSVDLSTIDPQALLRQRPDLEAIEAENRRDYGEKAHLFNQAVRAKWVPQSEYRAYVENILRGWEGLWQAVDPYVGESAEIRTALQAVGVPLSFAAIRRTPEQAREALLHGSRYRSRYTILDLAWDLGIFPGAADEVLELSGLL